MCLRKKGSGRGTVFPWSDAPPACQYAVDDTVYSGASAGRVVSVDAAAGTMDIIWNDTDPRDEGGGAITYPLDATYLRKAMPWE